MNNTPITRFPQPIQPHMAQPHVRFQGLSSSQSTAIHATDTLEKTEAAKPQSLLIESDSQKAYSKQLDTLLSPFTVFDVQNWDETRTPPLPVLKALTDKRIFVAGVHMPDFAQAQPLLNNPDVQAMLGQEKLEKIHQEIKQGLPAEARTLLNQLAKDGQARAMVNASAMFAKKLSVGVGTFLGVNTGLFAETVAKMGTTEQQALWLNTLNSGICTYGFGLTEDKIGSNPRDIETTFTKETDKDGKTTYRLNGNKKFIGNAARVVGPDGKVIHPGADFLIVFAVNDPKLPPKERVFHAFVVPRKLIGEENIRHTGGEHNKMGLREVNNGDFDLKDVKVPEAFLLGTPDENIYPKLMGLLDETRLFVGAMSLGTAEASLDIAEGYIKERSQNGGKIERFQAVTFPLKQLRAKAAATKLLLLNAAKLVDEAAQARAGGKEGDRFGTETAMAKMYASELAEACAQEAQNTLGGRGFLEDPKEGRGLPKRRRDTKVLTIYEGTTKINKNVICGGTLGKEAKRLRKSKIRSIRFFLLGKQWSQRSAYNIGKILSIGSASGKVNASYRYGAADVMFKYMPVYKRLLKTWEKEGPPARYAGWDQKSLERQAGIDASLPFQERMQIVADIATLDLMTRLAKKQITLYENQPKLSTEEQENFKQLKLFMKFAAHEAQDKARMMHSHALAQLEEEYIAEHAAELKELKMQLPEYGLK